MIKPFQYDNTKVETKPTSKPSAGSSGGGIKPFNYAESPSIAIEKPITTTPAKSTEPVSVSAWKPGQRQETISAYDPSKSVKKDSLGDKLRNLSDKIFHRNESDTARTIRKQQDSFETLVNKPQADEVDGKSPFSTVQTARDVRKARVPSAKGIVTGLTDVSKSDTPFAGALIDATEIGQIYLTAQKMKKGEEVSPEEYNKLLEFYTKESELSALRESDAGYRVGAGLRESLTFMAELGTVALMAPPTAGGSVGALIAERGVIKGAREIATKMLQDKVLKELLQKELKAYGLSIAKKGAIVVGSQEAIHLPENTLQRMVGTPQFTVGNGKIDVSFANDGQSLPEATLNAFTGILVETASEYTGGVFSSIPKAARNQLVKAGILKTIVTKNPNLPPNAVEKIISAIGWNGVIQEMGEEQIGNVANGVLEQMGLGDTEFHVPTMSEIAEQFLSFALMGTVITGVSNGYKAVVSKNVQENTPKDVKDMADTLGDYIDTAKKEKTPAQIIKDLETIGVKTEVADQIVQNAMKDGQQNAPLIPLDLTKLGEEAMFEMSGTTVSPDINTNMSEISPEALEQSIDAIFSGKTMEDVAKEEVATDTKKEKIQPLEVKKAPQATGKVPTFKEPEFNDTFDENPVVFNTGSYVIDRDGTVHEVVGGNEIDKNDPLYDLNIGSLRTRQLGVAEDYLNYANQVRPATAEEVAEAKEYEKNNPPVKKPEPEKKKKTKVKKATKTEEAKEEDKPAEEMTKHEKDRAGFKSINPALFKKADKAKTVDEFIDAVVKADKTTRKNVSIENLTEFFNRVKGIEEKSAVDNLLTDDIAVGDTFESEFGRVFTIGKIEDGVATEIGHESDTGYDVNLRQLATWDKIETPAQAEKPKTTKKNTKKGTEKETFVFEESPKEFNKKQLIKAGFGEEAMGFESSASIVEINGVPAVAYNWFDSRTLGGFSVAEQFRGKGVAKQYITELLEEMGGSFDIADPNKAMLAVLNSVGDVSIDSGTGTATLTARKSTVPIVGFEKVSTEELDAFIAKGEKIKETIRERQVDWKEMSALDLAHTLLHHADQDDNGVMLDNQFTIDSLPESIRGPFYKQFPPNSKKTGGLTMEVFEDFLQPLIDKEKGIKLKDVKSFGGIPVTYISNEENNGGFQYEDLTTEEIFNRPEMNGEIEIVEGSMASETRDKLLKILTDRGEKPLSKRDKMLLDYRKETLPALNMNEELRKLDVFVDKITELDPNKEADKFYTEDGATHRVKTSYPASLGEMGNYDVSYFDSYPTVEDIVKNTLEIYQDFPKNAENTARDENIGNAIAKAIDSFTDSGMIKKYDNRDNKGGVSNSSNLSEGEDSPSGRGSTSQVSRYDRATMLAQLGNGLVGERTAQLTKKQRQLINEEVESLLTTRNFSTNTEDYSAEDRLLMSAYTGSGGKESVGATGAGLLNEYYTPPKVISKIWDIAKKLSPNAETAFEPSVGTGRFIDLSPVEVDVDGAEISKVSGTIASVLYPDSNITIGDFQELFFDKKTNKQKSFQQYDLVVGNPPFGDRAGFLKGKGEESDINREEEYFIKRGLDMVKEGGYLIYVVNSSFLKKGTSAGKNAISQLGQLEVAYRLPEDSFEDTTIGTDIVVFKKNETLDMISVVSRNQTLRDDMYFRSVMNMNNILGETLLRKNRFGQPESYVKGNFDEAIDKINPNLLTTGEVKEDKETLVEQGEVVAEEQIAVLEEDKKKSNSKVSTPKKGVVYKQTIFPNKKAKDLIIPKQNISNKTTYSPIEVNMLKKIDRDLAIQNPTPTERQFLNYLGGNNYYSNEGDYFTDTIYFSGEIYKKLDQLEKDKETIINQLGQEQFDKQKKGLEAILPKRVGIKEVAFDPLDRHIADIKTKDKYGKPSTVLSVFADWVRMSDVALSPRVQRWDVLTFVRGQNLSKGTKPIEGYIKSDARRLFNQFLKNELAPETQKEIEDKYNTEKNGYVQPDYTKIPIEIENMAKQFRGRDFLLSETQKNGIGFLVNKGSGLIAYGVGVGKTHTLAIATVANMQKGWSTRPLYIVPKSTIDKTWLATLQQMFPTLVINNLEGLQAPVIRRLIKEKGEDKTQWIKDGELSVISHEGLLRLGLNEEELRTATGDLRDALWIEPKTKRGGEKTKNEYDEIAGNAQKYVTDVMISDLGFDHISVDEVHNFRKVFQGAKAEKTDDEGRTIGKKRYANILGGTPSRRAQQLFLISQYIQKKNNNRNVFLASATPFENHATEVYNILSFVARDRMRAMGILNINDFFASFANFEVELDRKLDGEWVNREKMKSFANLPTLQNLLKEFIDYQEDPTLVRPDRRVITPHLQMSELQTKNLVRIQNLLTGVKDQVEDTEGFDEESKAFFDVSMSTKEVDDGAFLKASTYSIANSVSPYFIKEYTRKVPTAEQLVEDSPKIKYALETLKTVKNDPKTADFGTFLFFGKMGVEYHPMIAEYIAKEVGYKKDEVAVLSGDVTDDEKEDIKERFNDGRVKVLLGGDQTKEGIDLQNNGFITMNLALGWNPTQISQVEGRVWRQGNRRSIAPLIYPLVENSGDSTIFNKFEEKGGRINDLFSYKGKMFDVGEIDPAEKKLSLLTDPKDKAKMQIEIDKTATYNERLLLENDVKELRAINADKNQMAEDLKEHEEQVKAGIDRWGGTLTEEETKELKKEIKSLKGKIERLDARIETKNITDINAEIGELEGKIIDMDAKIKAIDKTYDEKLAFFSEQYKKDIKNRKSMPQHMEQIKTLIDELVERTPEEIDEIRAKKIADEEARKMGSIPEFQVIDRPQQTTLKTLERLGDRKSVSKQFISDLARKTDIKKVEKDILDTILEGESGTIDVLAFKQKVMEQVLPITIKDRRVSYNEAISQLEKKGISIEQEMDGGAVIVDDKSGEYLEYDDLETETRLLVDIAMGNSDNYEDMSTGTRYKQVTLPEEVRGNVTDYREHIYETPIRTFAGDIHFGGDTKNYFGHTRVEDMVDGDTRRVIEVQSDLFQRNRLSKEARGSEVIDARLEELEAQGNTREQAKAILNAELVSGGLEEKRNADIAKLKQYSDPTAHFFMARKEIALAVEDGKTRVLFPSGETAMKIEGLATNSNTEWRTAEMRNGSLIGGEKLTTQNMKVGQSVAMRAMLGGGSGGQWVITKILEDGKFKAIEKRLFDLERSQMFGYAEGLRHKIPTEKIIESLSPSLMEEFNTSDKVDTNNPIYKFYENDLGKYLKNKYDAVVVKDLQGVSWYEVDLTKEKAQAPLEAFQKETEIDESLISFGEAKSRVEEYKNRLKLDFDVDFADVIFTGGINKDGSKERAYAVTYNNKISLIDNVRKTTGDHEMVHIVMNHMDKISAFDGITRDQLLKAMNGGKDYTDADLERLSEELAINFEKKVQGVELSSLPMVVRKFLERLEILLTKLLKAIGKDADVIQDFYRRLYSARSKENLKLESAKALDQDVQFKVQDKQVLAFNEARAEYLRTTRVNFQKMVEELKDHSVNLRRKDINFFDQIFAQSRDLFLKDKVEFKQADELMKIGDERRMKKSLLDTKFANMLKPYFGLKKDSKAKVNEVLVAGDIEVKEYSDTELARKGLSQAEIDGYKAVRKSFNVAHDLLLSEMEANGVPPEEVDQFRADRIGYLPHKWKYRFAIKKQVIKTGGDPKDSSSWRTESMDVYRTAREADKAFAEMVKNNTTPDEVRYINDTLDSLDVDFFSEQRFSFENMKSIIAKAKVPGEIKGEMLVGLRNMVKEKGFGRNFIKRTGIEGYEKKEIPEIIANYFAGLDGFITKMEAGKKYYGVLEKIDARRQKKFYEWTRNSIAYDMGNTKEGDAFKAFAYIFFLANDISFLVTNMTQNFTVGIGELSKLYTGSGKIVGAETTLLKAMADLSIGNTTAEEKAVIKGLVDLGRLGGEMTAELMGFKNNPVYAGVSSFLNKALYNSTAVVEKNVNRIPAFLAARRILKSKGLSDKEANEQALAVSDDIHFRYGKQHRPEFMRGRKSVLFVFNHYMRSFLYQLSRDLKNREFIAVSKKLFYTTLLGGTASLPFARLLKEIYKWIWGPDPEEEEEETLGSLDLALERGIPASFLNIDLSGRVGIDIMLLTNVVDELDTPKTIKEKVGNIMTAMLGAVGSLMVERIPKGVDLIDQGRYTEAGAKLLPDFIGNWLKAYNGADQGVQSQSGNPLIDANGNNFKYTTYEAWIRATGYTPTREQLAWDEQSKKWDLKNKNAEGNSEVKDKISKLIRAGKVEEARKYQEEARLSGELSSGFDYVKDNVKDEAMRTAVEAWETSPKTQIQLDKMEKSIAEKMYGPKYSAANLTSVTQEFAFRRNFGYDDKNANDLRKATSNKDKVLVLKRIKEELGPEEFRLWFNKGRKVVQYESGGSGYVLISDPLKDLYTSSK